MDQEPELTSRRKRHPKPTQLQNSGRVIRKAAQIIEDRGWVQKQLGSKERGFCIWGAMNMATGHDQEAYARADSDLLEWLRAYEAGPVVGIPVWNDTPGRTRVEVLLVLNKFADEADPQWP